MQLLHAVTVYVMIWFHKTLCAIKSWTFAMALQNTLIDQLDAGLTLGCINFMLVQYTLILSGF